MTTGLESVTQALGITEENARFFLSEAGLLMLSMKEYEGRAFLALAFPFETEEEYISVLNEEKEELGMIRSLKDFGEETAALLREELRKKYFAPKISAIRKLIERHGGSFGECETDYGPLSLTVRDTYKSMIRAGADRLFVVDHDGCRYEIPSWKGMDKKSYSKIELYL